MHALCSKKSPRTWQQGPARMSSSGACMHERIPNHAVAAKIPLPMHPPNSSKGLYQDRCCSSPPHSLAQQHATARISPRPHNKAPPHSTCSAAATACHISMHGRLPAAAKSAHMMAGRDSITRRGAKGRDLQKAWPAHVQWWTCHQNAQTKSKQGAHHKQGASSAHSGCSARNALACPAVPCKKDASSPDTLSCCRTCCSRLLLSCGCLLGASAAAGSSAMAPDARPTLKCAPAALLSVRWQATALDRLLAAATRRRAAPAPRGRCVRCSCPGRHPD